MCLTQSLIHAECRHAKSSETFSCLSGLSPSGICLESSHPPLTSELLANPGYCMECQTDVEEQMCSKPDAEARELEVDIIHLKELYNITVEKHEIEIQECACKLENLGQKGEGGENEDGSDASNFTVRLERAQRELNALKQGHEDVEFELKLWVVKAEEALIGNREERDRALGEFRAAQGLGDGVSGE
ncbi:hypothetical protein G7Y79_00004g014710 [Physcia stellaris]|nr:hypothetical protein G7Y79_00004g014710 [Physcia stellaris]